MSSEWSRKRGREGEEKGGEERKEGDSGGSQSHPPAPAPPQGQPPHPPSHHNAPRYPHPGTRAPEGYYQPVYPPGDGSAPQGYPPPRGYEGAPPYGMPPPHMPGYPMYPYQPPMYPHYPGYPPPHMPYGYPPPDPSMAGHPPPPHGYPPRGDEQGANVGPYGAPHAAATTPGSNTSSRAREDEEDRKSQAKRPEEAQGSDDASQDTEGDESIVPGAVTARLKTYIKPRNPSSRDVLDRRSRKNAQSRARAEKLRERVVDIEKKHESERTEEEQEIFRQYEARRQRKNDRSRERALEKKEEIDRILAKPEKKRTKIEKAFLDNALGAKKRKNEGDRLRRQRLKELGLSSKGSGVKPGISARGPLPPKYHPGHHHMPPPHGYGSHMGEIPMSPMPPMGGHHHPMQSPGGFGSPGMMPNMGYPSPQHPRRPGGPGGPGVMETPGRPGPGPGGAPMPYMPPSQSYETSPANSNRHHYQQGQHPSSRVEERRHPDGSMSISIGGGAAGGSSFGGETRMPGSEEQSSMNISDVSHLLLYDNGEEGEAEGTQESEPNGEDKLAE